MWPFRKKVDKKEWVTPYQDFLTSQYRLPESLSVKDIKASFPEGSPRLWALKTATELAPGRSDLWYAYASSVSHAGLYSEEQVDECIALVQQGLQQKNIRSSHRNLQKILRDLNQWRDELLYDPELNSVAEPKVSSLTLFNAGELPAAMKLAEREIRESEKNWDGYDILMCCQFDFLKPDAALKTYKRYKSLREKHGLNGIPGFRTQERLIGYLAQLDLDKARREIAFWQSFRTVILADSLTANPLFRDMFPIDSVDAYDLKSATERILANFSPVEYIEYSLDEAESYFGHDTVMAPWKLLDYPGAYVWLMIGKIYGMGIWITGDFAIRPDVIDESKAARFPRNSKWNVEKQAGIVAKMNFPDASGFSQSINPDKGHDKATWLLRNQEELEAFLKAFMTELFNCPSLVKLRKGSEEAGL